MSDDDKITKAIYSDVASPALREVGTILARAVHASLAPIRGMIWSIERVELWLEGELERRLQTVSPDRILPLPPEVGLPVLLALTHTSAEELRGMFANLVATAMDSGTAELAHPAFAETIRQMSPIDARIFSVLLGSSGRRFANGEEFGNECEVSDRRVLEVSLSNLTRLGLVEGIWSGRDTFTGAAEVDVLPGSVVITPDQHSSEPRSGKAGDVERILNVTPWGDQFARACVTGIESTANAPVGR